MTIRRYITGPKGATGATGPTGPTGPQGEPGADLSTEVAELEDAVAALPATYAPLASPTFTGNVVVPAGNAATEAAQISAYDAALGQVALVGREIGDTGWRTTTSWDAAGTITGDALGSGWVPRTGVPGYIRLRRVGPQVILSFAHLQTSGSDPTGAIITVPEAFRPVQPLYSPIAYGASGVTMNIEITAAGVVRRHNTTVASGQIVYGSQLTWITDAAWPTVLPGTAFP